MEVSTNHFLKFVPFSKFDLWDAKRYTSKSVNSNFEVVKLSSCINEESKKYKLFLEEEKDFGILGVNNRTGIFDAYVQKGKDINQPYKKMEIGWIAYNPYRINVGSIGIRLQEHINEYISPAYVVFSCKENLLPEFLFLVFKTDFFNKVINENTTGSVRQNLSFDKLKDLEIPLPTLQEQQEIVEAYFTKINEANQLEVEANNIDQQIEKYLFTKLGISVGNKNENKKGLNLVEFKDVLEWGTDKLLSSAGFESKQFKLKSLSKYESLVEDVFRGKSPKYADKSDKYILNQKCNRWNKIELEFAKTVVPEWYNNIDQKFFTKEGDIIINSTGEGTIGRASYVSKDFEGLIYDSHILLLRLGTSVFNPELFVELFNSDFGQSQVNQIKSAQATKQTELGVNNLLKIEIPVVQDVEKQKIIVEEIKVLRQRASENIIKIEELKCKANEEFEKAIFQ